MLNLGIIQNRTELLSCLFKYIKQGECAARPGLVLDAIWYKEKLRTMAETPCPQNKTTCHTSVKEHRIPKSIPNICGNAVKLTATVAMLWACPIQQTASGTHCHLQLPNIASHLISSELELPARAAARTSYSCWTMSLLRTSGCFRRQDLPKARPSCQWSFSSSPEAHHLLAKSWIHTLHFISPFHICSMDSFSLDSKQFFFPPQRERKKKKQNKKPVSQNNPPKKTKWMQ